MVKMTPDDGAEGEKHATSTPAGGHQRAAERKSERRCRGDVDRHQLRGDGIDRDGANGGAEPGAGQGEIQRKPEHHRKAEAISRFSASVSPNRLTGIGKEGIAEIGAAEHHQHDALNDEHHAECGQDAVDFECVARWARDAPAA